MSKKRSRLMKLSVLIAFTLACTAVAYAQGPQVYLQIPGPYQDGDLPYVYEDEVGGGVGGDGEGQFRFLDANTYVVYRMDVSGLSLPADFWFETVNEFLVKVSNVPPAETGNRAAYDGWRVIAEEPNETRDGSNRQIIRYPFTEEDLSTGEFFLWIGDSRPQDGWGGQVSGVQVRDLSSYYGSEKAVFVPLPGRPMSTTSIDPIWGGVTPIRMSDPAHNAATPTSVEDLSGQFMIGYHENSMFLFLEITDDVAFADPGAAPWDRAGVEIYVDLPRAAWSIGDGPAQANAWRTGGGPSQMRFQYDGASRGFGPDEGNMTDADNVFRTLRSGGTTYYEIELKTPSHLTLSEIESFGFVIMVNDEDNNASDRGFIAWWGGPEQPVGEYNDNFAVDPPQWQSSAVWAEAGFAQPDPDTSYSGDGMSYQEKTDLGLNPWRADTSGDGIPDAWILSWPSEYNLDPLNPNVGSTVIVSETGLRLRQIFNAGGNSNPETWPDLSALPLSTAWSLMLMTMVLAAAATIIMLRKRQAQ